MGDLKSKTPDEADKHEIAGRMYEATDLLMAIENGSLTSIDEIKARLSDSSRKMGEVLKLDTWVYSGCCLDLNETIARSKA
jgi:hypothetical protein